MRRGRVKKNSKYRKEVERSRWRKKWGEKETGKRMYSTWQINCVEINCVQISCVQINSAEQEQKKRKKYIYARNQKYQNTYKESQSHRISRTG